MQESWGNGGEEMSMSTGQWDAEDGDMWNSPTSQESSSSCNSWGNGPKKGPSKVRQQHLSKNYRQTDGCRHSKYCCCKKIKFSFSIIRLRWEASPMRLGS